MKKILFFINTLSTGGAERVLIDLVSKLPRDEYVVTVQTLLGGLYEKELPAGVTFRKIIHTGIPKLDRLLLKVLSKLPKLTGRLFIKNDYDIEVAYLEGVPTKIISSRTGSRAKKIAFVHIDVSVIDFISPQYPSKSACLSQYRTFDRVCFVSEQARDGFLQVFGPLEKASVIHNVVDFDRIRAQAAVPTPNHYCTQGLKLAAVGRLTRQKGFDRLIRICAELEKDFDFELHILGGGEEQQELEAVIAETGAHSVRLVGMQSNPYTWMQQADLLVCSSFAEGYSTTVVEALALGLPVLTTACAGMDEILGGGKWGKIVDLSNEALRRGLQEILADPTVYDDLKQRAMTRRDQLTGESSIEEYLQLFDSILAQQPPRKLLFFINTLNTGGAERVLVDLAAKLPKDQYEVTVQALQGGSFQNQLPEHVIYRQMVRTKNPALSKFLMRILSKLPKLTGRLFIKNDYDIEVAYLEGFPTKVIAKHSSKSKKLAFVHTNVAQADIISIQYPDKETCLRQYQTFDKVCFVSDQAMEGFSQVIGRLDSTEVIHNVVDFDRVRQKAQEPAPGGYTAGGRKLIAVGRLIDLKGFDRLIRICAELEQEFEFELLILGDGDQRAVLEEEITKTGCKSVRLVGMQENPYAWMQQAELLVCSSFSEGYSTTIVEALALGLPVITTACAGMKEILEDGKWGKIVDLSDEALRDGLREVLGNAEVYADLKRRAQTHREQLTDEASVQEYRVLFDSMTN